MRAKEKGPTLATWNPRKQIITTNKYTPLGGVVTSTPNGLGVRSW